MLKLISKDLIEGRVSIAAVSPGINLKHRNTDSMTPGNEQIRVSWQRTALFRVGLLVLLLGIVALVAFSVMPQLRIYRAQATAAEALNTARQNPGPATISQAVLLSERAQRLAPDDIQAALRLAAAYMLSEQDEAALEAAEIAYGLQPNSLLAKRQIALSYEQLGRYEQASAMWQSMGLQVEAMRQLGDAALGEMDIASATRWYNRVARLQTEPDIGLQLRQLIVALSLDDSAQQAIHTGFGVENAEHSVRLSEKAYQTLQRAGWDLFSVSEQRRIAGVSFQRLDGLPVEDNIGDGTGALWWPGPVFAFLDVQASGTYTMTLQVWHGAPPPVEMSVALNGKQLDRYRLERGDASWEEFAYQVQLASGLNLVQVTFIASSQDDGQDRNAGLRFLQLQNMQQ